MLFMFRKDVDVLMTTALAQPRRQQLVSVPCVDSGVDWRADSEEGRRSSAIVMNIAILDNLN